MEGADSYLAELEAALAAYSQKLNEEDMPVLKEHFILYKSVFDGFTNLLLKKGLITEDPYKYDTKISEVEAPSKHPVTESEKTAVISQRLSQFERQLDFLNHFFQFNTEYMTLPRIKNITALVRWIDWSNLSGASTEVNTQILGGIAEKIKQGADPMSTSLLVDSVKKLVDLTKQILSVLRKISVYQREKYKYDIRRNIGINKALGSEDKILADIKSSFKSKMEQGTPFVKSLILEVIAEETTPGGNEMKNEVLKKLEVKKKVKKKKEINFKPILLEALRIFSTAGISLTDALTKIKENSTLLETKNLSFGEKFKLWLMNLSGKKKQAVYDIDYFDENTGTNKRIKIDLNSFLEEGFREARIVSALSNKMSNIYHKLESSPEDKILTFLDNHSITVKKIAAKLDPLNTYFKSEVSRSVRNSVKGVKLEISSIKNALIKTNQKKLEYIARVEEIEQLKKLGIDTSPEED